MFFKRKNETQADGESERKMREKRQRRGILLDEDPLEVELADVELDDAEDDVYDVADEMDEDADF